jgi:hypothetical protein
MTSSPVQLPNGTDYPYSRKSNEHLLRIQSVVIHYKEKFGLPVWLMRRMAAKSHYPQGQVCTTGHHMFYGAAKEAYGAIDQFVFGSVLKQ